jgi:hypothetical protein
MLTLLLSLLATDPQQPAACIWNRSTMPGRGVINLPANVRGRSPQDSLTFQAGGSTVKVCYSRPSLRGRTMIGGEGVPYGQVWRTGANEATMIHTTGHLLIAGIHLDAGTYALYTVPGEREWEVIINRSYMQWGHESTYTDSVRTQEVGRGRVAVRRPDAPVEQFTIRSEPASQGDANLILEWENSRVVIPVQRMR